MKEFDENAAARFINAALTDKYNVAYPDDEIINIIDMIWDWYDENGFTDIDFDGETEDEDADVVVGKIAAYVKKLLAKDADSPIDPLHVECIVRAETDYENTLDPLA